MIYSVSISIYIYMYQGVGGTRLEPPEDRIRKSMSNETTFKDTGDRNILLGRSVQLFNKDIRFQSN